MLIQVQIQAEQQGQGQEGAGEGALWVDRMSDSALHWGRSSWKEEWRVEGAWRVEGVWE